MSLFFAAVFLKPFPCSYFIAVIPGIFSAAISVFFFAAIFLKPFPCSYFIAVIPGFFSAAMSFFFCSCIPETISLQISSQSSLDFFLQPCLFFFAAVFLKPFPCRFHRSHPWIFFCSHVFFFAAVFLKPFPCRFHRSHPWNFFCSHF